MSEWKRKIIIDIDTSRRQTVQIGVDENTPPSPVDDMACLCEALCTLIHLAHKIGIKKDHESLRDCINHLQKGFADASYVAYQIDTAK